MDDLDSSFVISKNDCSIYMCDNDILLYIYLKLHSTVQPLCNAYLLYIFVIILWNLL